MLSEVQIPEDDVIFQGICNIEIGENDAKFAGVKVYVAESCMVMVVKGNLGFKLEYEMFSLHARQSNEQGKLLYIQYEEELTVESDNSSDEDESCASDDQSTVIQIYPQDPDDLNRMYDAICHCELKHPCPDDDSDEDQAANTMFHAGMLKNESFEDAGQFDDIEEDLDDMKI